MLVASLALPARVLVVRDISEAFFDIGDECDPSCTCHLDDDYSNIEAEPSTDDLLVGTEDDFDLD